MGCRCPKVTRNVSVIRSPCSCPPACQSSPPQPIQNVRPAARSGAERSPARSGDTNSKPPVDCLKSSRSSMFQLNVAALVATQFLEIPKVYRFVKPVPSVLMANTVPEPPLPPYPAVPYRVLPDIINPASGTAPSPFV